MKILSQSLTVLLMFFLALSGSGCASIMSGPNQTVTVKSKPDGAKAVFYDTKGVAVASGSTPATVILKRRHNYVLKVEKEQYESLDTPVKGGLNGWYFGNILFGGVVGMLIVDPATGAMWSLSPDDVTIEMAEVGSGKTSFIIKEERVLPPPSARGGERQMNLK